MKQPKPRSEKQRQQWKNRTIKGDLASLPNWVNSVCQRITARDSLLSEASKTAILIAAKSLEQACYAAMIRDIPQPPKQEEPNVHQP